MRTLGRCLLKTGTGCFDTSLTRPGTWVHWRPMQAITRRTLTSSFACATRSSRSGRRWTRSVSRTGRGQQRAVEPRPTRGAQRAVAKRERALARAHFTAAPVEEQQPGRALSLLVPGQERRSWRARRARSREGGVVSCPGGRPLIGHSSGGCLRTRGAASTGKGDRMRAECPRGVPFRTQHPLGAVVNRPSVGLTDEFSVPCWPVRRRPTHGRLTPCGN